MNKDEEIQKLNEKIKVCKQCPLYKTATQAVPGEGGTRVEIMFIGEAPGYWEDQKGRPFVGEAGKLLDKSLTEIGLSRSEVFITNILKHRPPGNRDPQPSEIEACRDWLDNQIRIISPRIIVTLGRFSMNKFLPGAFISSVHGQSRWIEIGSKKYLILPFYHPAAALRSEGILRQFKSDFEKLRKLKDNINSQPEEFTKKEQKDNPQLSLL